MTVDTQTESRCLPALHLARDPLPNEAAVLVACLRKDESPDEVRRATDGMDVDVVDCVDGARFLLEVGIRRADLLLLPANTPVVRTEDIIASVRTVSTAPVLVTVADSEVEYAAGVLSAGATRLIPFPYSAAVLSQVLRDYLPKRHLQGPLQRGSMRIDPLAYEVTVGDRRIHMSARDLEVLTYLMRHSDRAVSPQELREEVWPMPLAENSKAITSAMLRLRTHFMAAGITQEIIQTVRGHGYRLLPPADVSPGGSSSESASS